MMAMPEVPFLDSTDFTPTPRRAIFAHAAASGVHTVFQGTYSIGCPGDTDADVYMDEDPTLLNCDIGKHADIETACQFALYPLGTDGPGIIRAIVQNCADGHSSL